VSAWTGKGANSAANGTCGPPMRYANGGTSVHNNAAVAMTTAAPRVEPRERSTTAKTIASRIVRTGQSSVVATVSAKSSTIGPGMTIQIEMASATKASANRIMRLSTQYTRIRTKRFTFDNSLYVRYRLRALYGQGSRTVAATRRPLPFASRQYVSAVNTIAWPSEPTISG
jgi:hypothetical protein